MNNQDFNNNQGFENQPEPNQNQKSAPEQGFENQAPADPFAPQFADPVDPKITEGEKKANSSKILGIIGLVVGLVCCGIAGIVLDIVALVNASTSKNLLGYEHQDAKTGKICAIVGIVIAVVSSIISIASGVISALAQLM